MNLFVFGLGYSAGHYLRLHRPAFGRVAGTLRSPERHADLARHDIAVHVFDGATFDGGASAALLRDLAEADAILVSVQPQAGRDPVLDHFTEAVTASRARRIVYLSTIGVYGDHDGAWIDEATPPVPESERGRQRLLIEDEWLALGSLSGKAVAVLRLAGIYGPGRNVLDDLKAGEARRIDKPGQVFNRIHVEDIAGTIAAAFAAENPHGVWNVTDDEPAPAPDVVAYGAERLGIAPPPPIPFAEADLSPMARSFYGANRRVSNRAIKARLGVVLRYPTYREGIDGLIRDMG